MAVHLLLQVISAMSPSISERWLARASLFYFALIVTSALGFYTLQNGVGIIGGEIAFSKLIWLSYAITFWISLPLLISLDPRTPAPLGVCFRYVLWMMLLRGAIEVVMLYITKNWSPIYGIFHDVVCMVGMLVLLVPSLPRQKSPDRPSGILWLHGFVTAVLFLPEMYFAWYMHTHFNTKGAQAVYFVPDALEHHRVLLLTGTVDIILTIYLPIFLVRWLYAKTDRTPS
ncbi:MAG: hypothetical protein V7642_6209 [Burkholderiales bacterium]